MSTAPVTIATAKSKALHALMFVAAVLSALVASATDVTSILGIVQKHLPGGSTTAGIVAVVLMLLTKAPVLLATVTGWISALKNAGASVFVLVFLAASLLAGMIGCAWWQKHGPQIDCAALATVTDAPQLVAIVEGCMAIAVSPAAIPACVEAAAASKWTSDIIACFSDSAQGKVNCPAYKTGQAQLKAMRASAAVPAPSTIAPAPPGTAGGPNFPGH